MDLLASVGGEHHDGHRVFPGAVFRILPGISVVDVESDDLLVEPDDEPVLEIALYAPMVVGAIADDGMLVLQDFDIGSAGIGVNHDPRCLTVREGEPQDGGPFGRRDFGLDIMVGKVNAVVIGLRDLAQVGENVLPLRLARF